MKSKLNDSNLGKFVNTWEEQLLGYSADFVYCAKAKLANLDKRARMEFSMNGCFHPEARYSFPKVVQQIIVMRDGYNC